MKTVVIVSSLVPLFVIFFVVSFRGLDLRRWSSWLYGAISFFCGVAVGLSLDANLVESIKAGGLLALMTLLGGATMRWHKLRYDGLAQTLFLQYGKEDDPSLFAKLVRMLLGKYQ
jgi:hypothetical protein